MAPNYYDLIRRNAQEIKMLHDKIHEAFKKRSKSPEYKQVWSDACKVFHESYDDLAFPGGTRKIEKIIEGDVEAIEAAICFVEIRPYFFRSQYLFQVILRRLKKANLDDEQRKRLERVIKKQTLWRQLKDSLKKKGD